MPKIINIDPSDDCKIIPNKKITDIFLLGFKIEQNQTNVAFYFVFSTDDEEEKYLVKHSYYLEDPKTELEYFGPMYDIINIDKYNSNAKETLNKILSGFDHTNSFYSNFKPKIIKDDNYICELIAKDSDIDRVYLVSIPKLIYMKLDILRSNIITRVLFNPGIDKMDLSRYDILENVEIEYIGSEPVSDHPILLNLFTTKIHNDKIGIIFVTPDKNKILTKCIKVKEYLGLVFKDSIIIDQSNILLLHVKGEDGTIQINVGIMKDNIIFITNESVQKSKLINYTEYAYY